LSEEEDLVDAHPRWSSSVEELVAAPSCLGERERKERREAGEIENEEEEQIEVGERGDPRESLSTNMMPPFRSTRIFVCLQMLGSIGSASRYIT
jgi:hypothetical protein